MKKISRRSFLMAAGVTAAALGLTACGAESTAPESVEGGDTTTPAAAEEISVAALESAYTEAYPTMWQEVCDAFTAATGIKVNLHTDKSLEDVIGPQMQGGEFPDVIHCGVGRPAGLTEQFVKGKMIADITDVLSMNVPGEDMKVADKISANFTENSVTNPYGDGKTYLAPMFYSPCGLFYNAGLLKEKGWEVPQTWDAMWELGEKAKAEGIALFTYPTAGYFDAFLYGLLYTVGGQELFDAATHYAEGVWDTDGGKMVFDIIEKLASYTNKKTPAQANKQDFKMNQQLVLDNEAVFMPNATWIVGEMGDSPRAEGFEWGMTALPAAVEGGDRYSYTFFEQAWIPAEAAHIDAAKQFVAFLYSDAACAIFAKGNAVQPVEGIVDILEGDNKLFYSIYEDGAKAAMGNFAPFKPVAGLGSVGEVFLDPINGLVSGDITRDKWVEDIKAASDEMRANLL